MALSEPGCIRHWSKHNSSQLAKLRQVLAVDLLLRLLNLTFSLEGSLPWTTDDSVRRSATPVSGRLKHPTPSPQPKLLPSLAPHSAGHMFCKGTCSFLPPPPSSAAATFGDAASLQVS